MSSVPPNLKALSGSVGRNGANRRDDVIAVQQLLNAAGAGIKEDGDCGRATISAIEDYQHNWAWAPWPDGRVDPGGTTWAKLVEGRLEVVRNGYVPLPQVSGNGYYSYASKDRQYGTTATLRTLVTACRNFVQKFPDVKIAIGDMCFADGAQMPPHKTHRNGRNADIRPVRSDGKMLPVTIGDPHYSRDRTRTLVALLVAERNVKSILFNDAAIAGVTRWDGHDNHLHVSMKE